MRRPHTTTIFALAAAAALLFVAAPPAAAAPASSASGSASTAAEQPKLAEVKVFPKEVNLTTRRDSQSLVVQAVYESGITRDVTGEAQFTFAESSLVKMKGGVVHPEADGKTKLTIAYEGRELQVPVSVSKADAERPISFRLDVMPVFAKAGCNTGSCHGSASGKDGFRLSLFGFDPAGDYYRITRQMSGRRINLAMPHESLLLAKATGRVSHTGGERMTPDSDLYATLLRWLEAGAPDDKKDVAHVTGIDLMPNEMVLDGEDATQQLAVLAHYSDGTDRDITDLATFITNNENSAKISPRGEIDAGQRGEAFVMARFDAFTVGSRAIILPEDIEYQQPHFPANNYIDRLVAEKLKKLRITPSKLCSDRVFLRRVFIDIVGKLPTREEYERFMNDDSPDKREKLVDRLLERKEFVEIWVMKFAELLQIRSSRNVNLGMSYKGATLYYEWLEKQFASNRPMDEIVQELIGSSGSTFTTPQTNFYEVERDRKKLAENVAQVFMGMRLQCAQCHNHPFDRWTQDDYYGFVAFFSQVGRKEAQDPRAKIIYDRGGGEVKHPVSGKTVEPKFLGGKTPDIERSDDRRKVLAEWLASPDNPFFAENLANIVWAHFFGRGIVEPVDDVRVSNPPSNRALLEKLGEKFTEYDYDFKKLVRDICTSRTYQLSTQTNPTNKLDQSNFSHAYIRRIRAEILFDVISQVTKTTDQNDFKGLPKGSRAVQIADGRTSTYFLTTFGRATRETVCSCEVVMEPNLSQALHLINGDTVNQKIRNGKVVQHVLENEKTPKQVVTDLYIRCFSREPTEREMTRILEAIKQADDQQAALRDVFWALLNSKEFLFNH